jgi:hypothetical protein
MAMLSAALELLGKAIMAAVTTAMLTAIHQAVVEAVRGLSGATKMLIMLAVLVVLVLHRLFQAQS